MVKKTKKKILVVAHFQRVKRTRQFVRRVRSGGLYVIESKNEEPSTEPLQFWERKNTKEMTSLVEIQKIKTKHSVDDFLGRVEMDYAAPLYEEVLEQIPEEVLPKVVAFEVLENNFTRLDGYDTITTILYGRKRRSKQTLSRTRNNE